jgi:hypothetical protein
MARVLVIDDNEQVRAVALKALRLAQRHQGDQEDA